MTTRRHFLTASAGFLALAACAPRPAQIALLPDGRPVPVLYRVDAADAATIRLRALDRVNALRAREGVPPLTLAGALGTAAATHARDLARSGRHGHSGSDGSWPVDRARRAGYRGTVMGENVSETYESELETIVAWMARPDTRNVLIDPAARDLGFGHFQDDGGKIRWVLMTGDGAGA